MSFGWSAATWLAISAVATTAVAVDNAENSRRATNTAADRAKENLGRQQEAVNKANRKAPDVTALMAANVAAGRAGQSSTILTGPQGTRSTLSGTSMLGG